ncbi:hypothetical protein SprV_0100152600 [Sparganum proliferum]
MFTPVNRRKLRRQARRETEEIIRRISEEVGGMPSSDTFSGSWSESDTEESVFNFAGERMLLGAKYVSAPRTAMVSDPATTNTDHTMDNGDNQQ